MLSELLQERAGLYAAGAMTPRERENFELVLEFHDELRECVHDLQRRLATAALAGLRELPAPSAGLRARILTSAAAQPRPAEGEGLVVTDADGRIEWINPAFTAMCGYTLDELKGRKPGHVLQGAATEAAGIERIRASLRERRSCRETLVNYHKDGSPYRVEVCITPVVDDEEQPLWFVARERKLTELDPLLVSA